MPGRPGRGSWPAERRGDDGRTGDTDPLRERRARGRPRFPAHQRRQPRTNTSSRRWGRAACSSTTTTTAGSTCSWSTAARSPIAAVARPRAPSALSQPRQRHLRGCHGARPASPHRDYGMGACAGDIDNDGRIDLYVTNFGPNALYRNDGDGTFTDVTRSRAASAIRAWSASCAFADLDRDGDLDLWVTQLRRPPTGNNPFCGDARTDPRFYCHPLRLRRRCRARSTATTATARSPTSAPQVGRRRAAQQRPRRGHRRLRQRRVAGRLRRQRHRAELPLPQRAAAECSRKSACRRASRSPPTARLAPAWASTSATTTATDCLDLIVTNLDFQMHTIFTELDGGLFGDATSRAASARRRCRFVGFGVGVPRLRQRRRSSTSPSPTATSWTTRRHFAAERPPMPQRKLLFRNTTARRFREVGRLSGAGLRRRKGQPRAGGRRYRQRRRSRSAGHQQRPDGRSAAQRRRPPQQRADRESDREAGQSGRASGPGFASRRGTSRRVRDVTAGSSYLAQNDLRVHFGLGLASQADRLEIHWPSGAIDGSRACRPISWSRSSRARGSPGGRRWPDDSAFFHFDVVPGFRACEKIDVRQA